MLTRDLADQGHFPAIDVLKSISRLRSDICPPELVDAGRVITRHMATYRRVEDMINIGAYATGTNPDIDKAVLMVDPINAFLRQHIGDPQPLQASYDQLQKLSGL